MLSIIIPTLNEATNLERLLLPLRVICPGAEVIVVDGGSADGTSAVARRFSWVRCLSSQRGRASQMNVGAKVAKGKLLLFLHADTLLPTGAEAAIVEAFSDPGIVAGRFDVRFDSPRPVFKAIAFLINLRSRLTQICTGDQALFVRRKIFEQLGGYPDIPLMEDVELSKRLKRMGGIRCLCSKVITSARKWERDGVLRTILLMWALRFLYFLGVSPDRLHRWYYGHLPSLRQSSGQASDQGGRRDSGVDLSASSVRHN